MFQFKIKKIDARKNQKNQKGRFIESKKVNLSNQKKYIYRIKKSTCAESKKVPPNQKRYSVQLHNLMNQKSPHVESKTIYLQDKQ